MAILKMKTENSYLNFYISLYLLFLLLLLLPRLTIACSTFLLKYKNQAVMGKNYDWDLEQGMVLANKRGVVKTAINYTNPAKWKSKYGSVTFNQYGHGFPTGGMNEAGLAIAIMWQDEAEFPSSDSRPEIDNMQWVQYQLDNAKTVEEVIASDTAIRIAPLSEAAIHYLVCDRNGGCAAIEYIKGKRICYLHNGMPVNVLTNSTYAESIGFLKLYRGFGGFIPLPRSNGSLERFVRIAHMVREYNPEKSGDIVKYGFEILSSVSMGDYTKWRIVYDIEKRCIYFRTESKKKIKKIDLANLNFSCETPAKAITINTGLSGDITDKFNTYTYKMNKKLIRNTFGKTYFLKGVSRDLLERVMHYPGNLKCE